MTKEDSVLLVERHQEQLQLTRTQFSKWAGKRFLVLIGGGNPEELEPFQIDKSEYGNMDDWLPVGVIEKAK